jgi:hypothetical protein
LGVRKYTDASDLGQGPGRVLLKTVMELSGLKKRNGNFFIVHVTITFSKFRTRLVKGCYWKVKGCYWNCKIGASILDSLINKH